MIGTMIKTYLTEDEKEQLARENIAFVYHMVKKFPNLPYSHEEKVSAGMLGMTKALNSYDPSKGYKLATFLAKVISNEILQLDYRERKHKNNISFDSPIGNGQDGKPTMLIEILASPEREFDWKEINIAVKSVLSGLTSRDAKIFERFVEGKIQKDIGKEFSLSQTAISRVLLRIIKAIKKEYWRGNSLVYQELDIDSNL